MLPDEPDQPKEEPDSESEQAGESDDSSIERKKLPAGWRPEHANRKGPVHVFVAEPDPEASTSPFGDKRYGTFRKQMVVAGSVIVFCTIVFSVLFWFRPKTLFFEPPLPPEEPVAAPVKKEVPILTAEQLRELDIEAAKGKLRAALGARDWAEIERLSQQILQKAPLDGEAWHARAWVLEKDRAYDEAAEAYGKAVAGGFLPSNCLVKRATMYRRLGKYDEAVNDLEESIRMDRDSVVASNLLAVAQIQAGHADAVASSIDAYERTGIVANADRFLLGKAALEINKGDFAKAANSLATLQTLVDPALFAVLVQDHFFDPYRSSPDLLPYLVLP